MKKPLPDLRKALLDLHKSLVDSERIFYEKIFRPIESSGEFLQLLAADPWFAWMHPMSQLIVAIDEALAEKEPLTDEIVDELWSAGRLLLNASEDGEGFSQRYFEALQRDPDVVLAHAKAIACLKAGDAPG